VSAWRDRSVEACLPVVAVQLLGLRGEVGLSTTSCLPQANPTQALFLVVIFRGQERFLVAPVFPRAGVSVWFPSGLRWAQVTSEPFVVVKPVSIGPDQAGFQ